MSRSVVLQDFDKFDRRWLLDIPGGRIEPTEAQPTHGLLATGFRREDEPRDDAFAAIYADDGMMWFQTGSQRWPLREVRVERRDGTNPNQARGVIKRADTVVAAFSYRNPLAQSPAVLDPTYDAIDAETDDFFLYLSNVATPEWSDRAAEKWSVGSR